MRGAVSSLRWWIFLACVVLGTFMGLFFQHVSTTAPLFRDVVRWGWNVDRVDFLALEFGFHFALRLNLGTLLGGVVGLWVAR